MREIPYINTLFIDNQSAISVANNPEHHGRMKHLDLRFYWLRDMVLAAVKAGLTQAVPKQQWRPVSENELILCTNYLPVPKQQWRPVSENELACTAASAQSWVHAYVIQKAAH